MTKKIILLSYAILLAFSLQGQNKLDFWRQQRKGANGDGGAILTSGTNPDAWFKAAAQAGIEFVRLNPVDWQGTGKDFLVGNADHFTTIPAKDLAYLLKVLNIAHKYQVKILLTMFVLPGARNAYRKHDYRLWSGKEYQQQAQQFWVQLAQALKNHPAIVGYNLLNEPHPARKYQLYEAPLHQFETWLKKIKNTTEDLNRFNRLMVKAIRKVDTQTPIVLNGWMHAAPEGMPYLEPINDPAILYAFHFYGPWAYSNYKTNKGRYSYPHHMPHTAGKTQQWDKSHFVQAMEPVVTWAKKYKIPAYRLIAEEFGVDRRVGGAQQFLAATMAYFNQQKWHWAFYSFRSGSWDGMDYELGPKKLHWAYWDKRKAGVPHEKLVQRKDNPMWQVFKQQLRKNASRK